MTAKEAIERIASYLLNSSVHEKPKLREALRLAINYIEEKCFLEDAVRNIRNEITEYKDDKLIHAERNEMIDIVLEIIDRNMKEVDE